MIWFQILSSHPFGKDSHFAEHIFQFGGLNHLVQPPTSDVRIMSAMTPESLRTSDCIHGVLVLLKHCHILTLPSALKRWSITFMRWVIFPGLKWKMDGEIWWFQPKVLFCRCQKSVSMLFIYIYIMYTICSIFADIRCCVQMMLYMTDCIFMIIHLWFMIIYEAIDHVCYVFIY